MTVPEHNVAVAEALLDKLDDEGNHETPEQKASRLGVPLIPKRIPGKSPVEHNPVFAVCQECGHGIQRMEYRSCAVPECPMGKSYTLQ